MSMVERILWNTLTSPTFPNLEIKMDPRCGNLTISPATGNFHIMIGKIRWYYTQDKRNESLYRPPRKIINQYLTPMKEILRSSTWPSGSGQCTLPRILIIPSGHSIWLIPRLIDTPQNKIMDSNYYNTSSLINKMLTASYST